MPPAWQTPLKALHHARVLFRKLRTDFVAQQLNECDEDVLDYLGSRQSEGKPFPEDYAHEPDDIKHVKNLENALYFAEQAFKKLGDLNLANRKRYDLTLITEAYEACHLLLNLTSDLELNFRNEINLIASGLASILNSPNSPNTPRASFDSHQVGLTLGRAIDHRKPTDGQSGYDLLTYFGAVFPDYPSHIEHIRTTVEKFTSRNPEYTPNIDKEKMQRLYDQGQLLSRTIANSNQSSLYFVFNLISLIRQTVTLWTHIYQEAGELNDTMKNLGRELLALFKYELLPAIFRGVDKLERQLLLKPGRLSKPLMEQIKPWHESLVQKAKLLIKFDETNAHLLKLEDRRFIELRIQPIQEKIETSTEVLHFVEPALAALEVCLASRKPTISRDLQQHILALTPYMPDADKPLLARLNKHMAYSWSHLASDWFNFATNFVTWSNEETLNRPTPANLKRTLRQLQQRWQQIKTDHEFKQDRYQLQITAIEQQAHQVLFSPPSDTHAFQVSEQEILEDTYCLPENQPSTTKTNIIYEKIGEDTYVEHPHKLSIHASWTLYRSYEKEIAQLKQAQAACNQLLNTTATHDAWQVTKQLGFTPSYTLALLDHNVIHKPQTVYVKIKDGALHYHVLKSPSKPCNLHLTTLEYAKSANYQGYIWDHDQKQLSYIAEDGNIHSNIALHDNAKSLKALIKVKTMMLKYIRRNKSPDSNQHINLPISAEEIHDYITSVSGHHPGIIQKASIPLADLGCKLTELTTPESLQEFLPHIFHELHERGHVYDEHKADCIRWYSSIQPYVASLDRSFDARITHLLSGTFIKKATTNMPDIGLAEARRQWCQTTEALSERLKKLKEKRNIHQQNILNQTFQLPAKPSAKLKHREFLLDTARFMTSLAPIKRQLHQSKKTCFKIDLALKQLNARDANALLKAEDYAWFQDVYVGSLAHATVEEIETQLREKLAYETLQIKRNEQLIQQLETTTPTQANANEDDVFLYLGHTYEPVVMQDDSQIHPSELQLRIDNNFLYFKFMHYGQELQGEVALQAITPELKEFNASTVVSNETLRCILQIAYTIRKQNIDNKLVDPSPDEALDLYQWYLAHHDNSEKLALYKSHAERKPELAKAEQEDHAPENRPDHLIKHTRISQYLSTLKSDIYTHTQHLSRPIKQQLLLKQSKHLLPYPEVGAQNSLIDLLKELNKYHFGISILNLPLFHEQPKHDALNVLKTPQQVLLLKRLMNVLYYLEQIVLELEQVNDKSFQIPYVMHLVISYLYVQDIIPLLSEIKNDPVLSGLYTDVSHQIQAMYKLVNHETQYYIEENHPDDKTKHQSAGLQTLLNLLKMLPERLSTSTDKFKAKRPELRQATEKSAHNIEKILQHAGSSWSYLLLLLDLPTCQRLLSDMSHDFKQLLEHAHTGTQANLERLNTKYLANIKLEADKLEHTLGLTPGLIAQPLNEILDEFYKGLITPLTPKVDKQAQLLCGNSAITQRIAAARSRKNHAQNQLTQYQQKAKTIQALLNACNTFDEYKNPRARSTKARVMQKFLDANHDTDPPHIATRIALNEVYQTALPTLKASLNSSDVYLASIQDVMRENEDPEVPEERKRLDCFVFDEQKSQLFHIDEQGKLNPQTGCKLFLKSIPADQDKPEKIEYKTTKPFPFNFKEFAANKIPDGSPKPTKFEDLNIKTKHPTLVQHGNKYYIYASADNTGWKYTELDAEVMAKMRLNFSRKSPLHIHTKYQAMYDEIATKTGLTYPIHLKKPFKTLRFIHKKKEANIATARPPETLYLSEHAINEYITSNSDFSLPQHKLSIQPGCCLISLKNKPTDFYELELPAGYGSYYAQISEYDLGSMLSLDGDYSKAKSGIIYLNEDPKQYLVKGMTQPVSLGTTDTTLDLSNLTTKLKNEDLKHIILNITSRAGHTPERTDILYYIDTETSSITPLPIPPEKQSVLDIKKLKDIHKEQIFDARDFADIEHLTGHRSDASLIIDINTFQANAQNIGKLKTLVQRSKAYYQGMIKTSRVAIATADEQLVCLKTEASTQDAQNTAIKKSIYTDYFKQAIQPLIAESVKKAKLQNYTLHPLTENTRLKPNRLYIDFKHGKINYRVINPAGKLRKSSIKLNQISWPQNKPLESVDDLVPYLPQLLKITAKKGDGHTRPHALADDYKAKLTAALLDIKEEAVAAAVRSGHSKTLDDALTAEVTAFNDEQLEQYKQLDAINQAVTEFRLYLKRTEKHFQKYHKTSSCFENEETLRFKNGALDLIETYAADTSKTPEERITLIQTSLKDSDTLDSLMAYHTYTQTSFQWLLQCVYRLLESAGLYTPEMTRRLDKVVDAVQKHEPPLPANRAWSFFPKTTQEKIKENMLEPRPRPAPEDDDSEPGSEAGPEIWQ